jgi:glycosyltransferase 2 family protein
VWVLRGIHFRRAAEDWAGVSWRWVALGILFDVCSYAAQGVRWKLLLTPFGHVKIRDSVRAVFAGLFANIFPLRPGELLRTYLVSKAEDIGFVTVLGSVGVERLIDLVVTTAALAALSPFLPLTAKYRRVAEDLGIATVILLAVFVSLILYVEFRFEGDPRRMTGGRFVPGKMMSALLGLHAMGTSPSFYPAVFTSLLTPFLQFLGLWAMMRAYGMGVPFSALSGWGTQFLPALVVMLVINLGVSLPNAPANVGSYQFFCVLGLSIFSSWDKTTVTGFSIFAFLMLTLPVLFIGFYAALRSGLSLRTMREQVRGLPRQARASQT